MKERVNFNLDNSTSSVVVEEPEKCPICKCNLKPSILNVKHFKNTAGDQFLCICYLCTKCYDPFIANNKLIRNTNLNGNFTGYTSIQLSLDPVRPEQSIFSDFIKEVSSDFVNIFNQSLASESYKLTEIAGIGYRKALEFLIKDFSIKENPDKKDKIENSQLGQCIKEYVNDPNLKTAASRAVWLGNDQTHYVQKFADKDIEDLKRLIRLTVHWIEMIYETREAEKILPIK